MSTCTFVVGKLCLILVIPRAAACQASLYSTVSQSLLKLRLILSMVPSNHLILCCSLLLLPSIFPSIRIFSNELTLLIRWPTFWSFSISSSNEYSGLISFRMGRFDLLAVQGTLKSLLQHCNLKTSISVLNLLYRPTLKSIHDYWQNPFFDYTDLCRQRDVSAF